MTVTQEEFEEAVKTILRARDEGVLQEREYREEKWRTVCDGERVFLCDCQWEYRIKPQPREWWMVLYSTHQGGSFYSEKEAHRAVKPGSSYDVVHVREVLDDE